jgi:hypothetical protein
MIQLKMLGRKLALLLFCNSYKNNNNNNKKLVTNFEKRHMAEFWCNGI